MFAEANEETHPQPAGDLQQSEQQEEVDAHPAEDEEQLGDLSGHHLSVATCGRGVRSSERVSSHALGKR